jgi:hypothetical protein
MLAEKGTELGGPWSDHLEGPVWELAFGKALYDRRVALGLSVADLAQRAGMTADEIECIEEGGTEPTVALLQRLAAASRCGAGRRRAPHRRP